MQSLRHSLNFAKTLEWKPIAGCQVTAPHGLSLLQPAIIAVGYRVALTPSSAELVSSATSLETCISLASP